MDRVEMEARRFRVLAAYQSGMRQAEVCRQFAVSRMTASRWFRKIKQHDSLAMSRAPGRPPRLSRDKLLPLFRDSTLSFSAIAKLIKQEYGVRYHPDHVGRIALLLLGEGRQKRTKTAGGGN